MASAVTWPPASLRQKLLDHRELEKLVREARGDAVESALARYLVVRSAGLVESVRDVAAEEYCGTVGHWRVKRRISAGLGNGLGVRPSQLEEFVGSFDVEWKQQIQEFFAQDDFRRKDELGALVAARKKIAHGDGEQVTAGKALRWSETAVATAGWLLGCFDPR